MAEFLINSDTVLNKLLKSLLKTYYLLENLKLAFRTFFVEDNYTLQFEK